ncbi:YhgE/Pip domain-containing protein [Adlercreutzia aquisgranensis]|uniref:YhgE/Pip domain-containing protein n=1 Tax=Adlercreutzia aquisgranensis TaxID=2941323 RepID=UPI00203B0965|nr:YhgE/Pip domain-containing protein [Adlercreutzia aquisgranensis]
MGNIAKLCADDVRRLFSNTVCVIITMGLIVLPSIFAWYNIIACWNVFDNTGNLKVAVANSDEGYESDLIPIPVNVGDQVVSALRANDQIHWVITDEEDAVDGARSGRYYAAVVIPAQFSRDMLTFYRSDAEHASIIYYSNEKKSAIAPKITDSGADAVSYQVNQVFAETLAEVAMGLANGLSDYAAESDVSGTIAALAAHAGTLADDVDRMADVLVLYGQLTESVNGLVSGSANLLQSATDKLSELREVASGAPGQAESLSGSLQGLSDTLGGAVGSASGAFGGLDPTIDKLFDEGETAVSDASEALRDQSSALANRSDAVGEGIERTQGVRDELKRRLDELASEQPDNPLAGPGQRALAALDSYLAALRSAQQHLDSASEALARAADKVDSGSTDLSTEREQAKEELSATKAAFGDARSTYDNVIAPQIQSLQETAQRLSSSLSAGLDDLGAVSATLTEAAGGAQSSLGQATSSLSETVDSLRDAAQTLRSTAQDITDALASGDSDRLREILQGDTQALATALSSPVGVERVPVFPADNFGSAMAPLYTTLALFIGALIIMVVVRPQPSSQQVAQLRNPKPRQLFLGHFGVCALLSLAQSTLMGLGNMFFLQVQVTHPWLFMVCFWAAGLVFTFIIYSLVFSFANLGKAIAVLLLIVQVTGCGGSFPLQILPDFVQAISPWLPATHVVDAMRAAMFGAYGNDFWIQIGKLALFVVPFAVLGLLLRKPTEKFMRWYVHKVESSKLIC